MKKQKWEMWALIDRLNAYTLNVFDFKSDAIEARKKWLYLEDAQFVIKKVIVREK